MTSSSSSAAGRSPAHLAMNCSASVNAPLLCVAVAGEMKESPATPACICLVATKQRLLVPTAIVTLRTVEGDIQEPLCAGNRSRDSDPMVPTLAHKLRRIHTRAFLRGLVHMRSSVPDGGRALPGSPYPGRLRAKAVQSLPWLKWTSKLDFRFKTLLQNILFYNSYYYVLHDSRDFSLWRLISRRCAAVSLKNLTRWARKHGDAGGEATRDGAGL